MNHTDLLILTICIITAMFSSIAPVIAASIAFIFAVRWALNRYRWRRFERSNIGDVEHREWLRNLFRVDIADNDK